MTSFPSLPKSGGYKSRWQVLRHMSADIDRQAIGTIVTVTISRAGPSCSIWFHINTQTDASGKIISYDTTSAALVRRKQPLAHKLIMPNSATVAIIPKYAANFL